MPIPQPPNSLHQPTNLSRPTPHLSSPVLPHSHALATTLTNLLYCPIHLPKTNLRLPIYTPNNILHPHQNTREVLIVSDLRTSVIGGKDLEVVVSSKEEGDIEEAATPVEVCWCGGGRRVEG